MRVRAFQLFGLGMALVVLALAAGNNGQGELTSQVLSQAQAFTVCFSEWEPFSWVDKNGEFVGFDLDFMRIVAILKGYKIGIKQLAEFSDIIKGVVAGNCDIATGIYITPTAILDFSDPYFDEDLAVLVREDSGLNLITVFQKGKTIGVLKGGIEEVWIKNEVIGEGIAVTLKSYQTYGLAEQDLINKKIDAVVEQESTAKKAVKASKRQLKIVGIINTDFKLGIAVTKGDPSKLLPRINDGMKEMKKKGIWNNLVEAYFGVDVDLDRVAQCWADLKGYLDKNQPNAYAENMAACMAGEKYKKPE